MSFSNVVESANELTIDEVTLELSQHTCNTSLPESVHVLAGDGFSGEVEVDWEWSP